MFKIWVVNVVMDFLSAVANIPVVISWLIHLTSHLAGWGGEGSFLWNSYNSSQQGVTSSNQWLEITNIDILIRNIKLILHHLRPKDSPHHWPVHHRNSQEERPLWLIRRGPLLSDSIRFLGVLRERSARQVPGGEWEWDPDPWQWRLRTPELDHQHQQRNPQWPFRRLCRGEKILCFASHFQVLGFVALSPPGKIAHNLMSQHFSVNIPNIFPIS